MKYPAMTTVFALTVAGLLGCGDSAGPVDDVLPAELAGSWTAGPTCSPSCQFTVTSTANPSQHVDLVAAAGLTMTLKLTRAGNATLTFFGQSAPGTARLEGDMLILESGGAADSIDYTVTGNKLDLKFRNALAFVDFTGDGIEDPGLVHAVLIK